MHSQSTHLLVDC